MKTKSGIIFILAFGASNPVLSVDISIHGSSIDLRVAGTRLDFFLMLSILTIQRNLMVTVRYIVLARSNIAE